MVDKRTMPILNRLQAMWRSSRFYVALFVLWPVAAAHAANPELFTEITGSAGLVEKPPIYPDGRYMTPEITPGGVALIDYNNDGLLDILVICHPPPQDYAQMIKTTASNRLFR